MKVIKPMAKKILVNEPEKLKPFLKDEQMATKEYAEYAKIQKNKAIKRSFKSKSKDESRHARSIEKIIKEEKIK